MALGPKRLLTVHLLAALAPLASADATVIFPQSVTQMTLRADAVVRAVPVHGSAVSAWDREHRLIVTRTRLTVLEALHGEPKAAELVVETPGGFLPEEDIGMFVPGSPLFVPDEEVILFLHKDDAAGTWRTVDLAAGKFEVGGEKKHETLTRRDLNGAPPRSKPSAPVTLIQFRAELEAAAATKAARVRGATIERVTP